MGIATQVRNLYKQSIRLPAARQFDRNCILSLTAAQLTVAQHIGVEVQSIVVKDTSFDVGPVACEIKLVSPDNDRPTTLVALAGTVGFCLAAGVGLDELHEGLGETVVRIYREAEEILFPAFEDGSFKRLVRELDKLTIRGERDYGGYSRA